MCRDFRSFRSLSGKIKGKDTETKKKTGHRQKKEFRQGLPFVFMDLHHFIPDGLFHSISFSEKFQCGIKAGKVDDPDPKNSSDCEVEVSPASDSREGRIEKLPPNNQKDDGPKDLIRQVAERIVPDILIFRKVDLFSRCGFLRYERNRSRHFRHGISGLRRSRGDTIRKSWDLRCIRRHFRRDRRHFV